MIILFGQRNYGVVDHIPGVGYVTTQFVYLNGIPIAPVKTYFVLEGSESGGSFRGKEIALSLKSVLTGYLRVWGFLACAFSAAISWALVGSGVSGVNWVGAVACLFGIGLVCAAASSALWHKWWVIPQGLFHLGSVVGVVAAYALERLRDEMMFFAVVSNIFLLAYASLRLLGRPGRKRSIQLLTQLGYDQEAATEITDERLPRRQSAGQVAGDE